ncbi:crosslink repair DNA glycosylase YcaQ family protein [Streptomyces sp. NPDC005349]|uniref:DNA glycosylase AlkZ-like family protein n=1 Tax=Streptomyces sp. NPDC005349 TaxID=3157037 RepID=UPI0033ABAC65
MDRQFLLRRTDHTPLEVTGRLVALQAQEPNWACAGLWSKIHRFTQCELTALLEDRQVAGSGLLRSTQHFAAAERASRSVTGSSLWPGPGLSRSRSGPRSARQRSAWSLMRRLP